MIRAADEPATRPEAPILLLTKLHPPPVAAQTVARERLLDRLSGGRGLRLTLVACPAGFGKSTLLAAWGEREARERPVAWVTLDEGDDDAVVLWSHVVEALRRARPALARDGLGALASVAPLREVVLPRLVNALVAAGDVVLVLDDVHRLAGAAARDSLAWFVDHRPASVQVVLASRTDPPLALGTLRARGQLCELRADALRFTTAEAGAFLNGALALDLPIADVELLVARTEGWPAGIYLAALSLAGATDRSALVAQFDGTSRHVVDYLTGDVLAGFEPELQEFMLRTSVLERLCPELCDAVLERRTSAAALAALQRSNLFLLALDDRGRWFRFHHLFAQILRLELQRREPALVATLHRRAYEWHHAAGTADEAIHHALAAQAFAEAGELIAASWVHYANAGRTTSVFDWLERLPAERVARDARLTLVTAWVAALRGDEGGMRSAVARARALGGLDDGPLPDGFRSLQASIAALCATFPWGDVAAILEHGARAAQLEGPASPWRAVVTWALGWGHYCAGELDAAERWLREAVACARPFEQWIVGLAAIADLSLVAGLRGDRDAQWRLALEAVDLARERGLLDAREVGEVHTAHGVALAAQGRADEALAALERGVFLRRLWAQPLDLADALIALGSVVASRGERDRAAAILDEAGAVLGACRSAGVLPRRLDAARGRAAADGAESLSARELMILRMLSGPLSEREIGRELHLSFNTVHSHVKAVYRKLGVGSRAAAVARARQRRLL